MSFLPRHPIALFTWALLSLLLLSHSEALPVLDVEAMKQTRCYSKLRDLNIAFFMGLSQQRDTTDHLKCSLLADYYSAFVYPVSVEYAIDQINKRPNFLHNISLGFVILDDCGWRFNTIANYLHLIPYKGAVSNSPNPPGGFSKEPEIIETCGENGWTRNFNVMGTIGPGLSSSAVMIAPLSTLFQIPMLLTWATSDELSDKVRFAYTMRMVNPDRMQAEAMTDYLLYFGWDYAILLYSEGPYGEAGAKMVERNAKAKGICLAFRYMVPTGYTDNDINEIFRLMSIYRNARAVMSFVEGSTVAKKVSQFMTGDLYGNFIWVASDYFTFPDVDDHVNGPHLDGATYISHVTPVDEDFRRYLAKVTVKNNPHDPFLKLAYETSFNCVWNETAVRSCYDFESEPIESGLSDRGWESTYIDGIEIYARAVKSLIEDNCPEAYADKSLLHDCVRGEQLHQYMLKSAFEGITGQIAFDSKGDRLGAYRFYQYQYGITRSKLVGTWDKATDQRIFLDATALQFNTAMMATKNRTMETDFASGAISNLYPVSVCSKPCKPTEYYIQKELPCCWECRTCRDNEILINNFTGCGLCALLTWPDPITLTFCASIRPEVISWKSGLVLGMLAATSVGLIVCLLFGAIFIKNSQNRLIKASSRQLMAFILFGIILAYLTVVVLLSAPSIATCYFSRFGFNLSVSLIYAPLMVKTSRIYRIFSAGKKGTKRPVFVGTRSQLVLVVICITLQIVLCVVSSILAPPLPLLRQQVPTEKYVEQLCDLPLSGLLPPLSLNLFFIIICGAYGFLTRKLPENFNESWYIFVSVATTTFLWLVFLPAYFTAFYASHQVTLLACCLIFNGTVTLLCLYAPKVYCVYFVDDEKVKFQTAGTVGTMSAEPSSENTSSTTVEQK